MKVTAELEGLEDIEKSFNNKLKQVKRYTAKAMADVTLDLLSRAVQLAPVDTGDLRRSGSASINGVEVAKGSKDGNANVLKSAPETNADEVWGEVGFSVEYAYVQHEDLSLNHPNGGQAKYLEKPFVTNTEKYIKHLENSVDKAIEYGE